MSGDSKYQDYKRRRLFFESDDYGYADVDNFGDYFKITFGPIANDIQTIFFDILPRQYLLPFRILNSSFKKRCDYSKAWGYWHDIQSQNKFVLHRIFTVSSNHCNICGISNQVCHLQSKSCNYDNSFKGGVDIRVCSVCIHYYFKNASYTIRFMNKKLCNIGSRRQWRHHEILQDAKIVCLDNFVLKEDYNLAIELIKTVQIYSNEEINHCQKKVKEAYIRFIVYLKEINATKALNSLPTNLNDKTIVETLGKFPRDPKHIFLKSLKILLGHYLDHRDHDGHDLGEKCLKILPFHSICMRTVLRAESKDTTAIVK